MKTPSLKDNLLKYIRDKNDWINGGELERYAMTLGYKGSTASRELRILSESENSPLLKEERKGDKVKSIWYRPKGKQLVTEYRVGGVVIHKKVEWSLK